jgi:ABC-2 type transport system permease protein
MSGPSGLRQGWLVAMREMRERSRSRGFLASMVIMVLVVLGVVLVPALLDPAGDTVRVGLAGATPAELTAAIEDQAVVADATVTVVPYDDPADGEQAVRDGEVDVLVVDAERLVWSGRPDERLRTGLIAAIQLAAVRERAAAEGISPEVLAGLMAPVEVENVELRAGGSPDDETAVMIMTVLLFIAISFYGSMVLTGVVEEKSSRVVEVLLARMPPRNLLAGKVAGIGVLGLVQLGVTALAAFIALAFVDSVDVPAARGSVLAWVVVWFVLGYALYAVAYGAVGSLASRTEDAQSVAGPVVAVLIAGYFASFTTIGNPDTTLAQFLALFPPTAPLAMPGRIAMGAASWWEPPLAVALTVATIVGLVYVGGRVYAGAILRRGPTLKLRDAWRLPTTPRGPSRLPAPG